MSVTCDFLFFNPPPTVNFKPMPVKMSKSCSHQSDFIPHPTIKISDSSQLYSFPTSSQTYVGPAKFPKKLPSFAKFLIFRRKGILLLESYYNYFHSWNRFCTNVGTQNSRTFQPYSFKNHLDLFPQNKKIQQTISC